MAQELRIEIERPTCISSGFCLLEAPEVFEHDEEFKAVARANPVPDSPGVHEAAENCPVEAIRLLDAETGEVRFPPD